MSPADWIGLGSLLAAAVAIYRTLSPMKAELEICHRERIELRRRLELVTAAIIGTLPREQRIDLLMQLDERIEPVTGRRHGWRG